MTDDTTRRDEDELADDPLADAGEMTPEDGGIEESVPLTDAELAEAEEAEAAAGEWDDDDDVDLLDEEAAAAQAQEAMADAQYEGLRARASWALVHKELLLLLFANCLFLAGALAAWGRFGPWDGMLRIEQTEQAYRDAQVQFQTAQAAFDNNPGEFQKRQLDDASMVITRAKAALERAPYGPTHVISGLDTIRGTVIFALAIYGFWVLILNFRYRQLMIWPFLLNALLALWVGIPGFTGAIGSERWDAAMKHLDNLQTKTLLQKVTVPLSTIPPGHWLLTFAGALVLIVLLKGVISGASSVKKQGRPAAAGSGGSGSRRRRK